MNTRHLERFLTNPNHMTTINQYGRLVPFCFSFLQLNHAKSRCEIEQDIYALDPQFKT